MCGKLLFGESVKGAGGAALLLLRFVSGLAFVFHGWPKIQNAFGWMGPDAPVPALLQALAAFSEFAGGLALIAGFLTRLAALGIACVMVTAIFIVHLPKGDPFVGMGSSYESAAVYLVIMIVLILRGAGICSLDGLLTKTKA